MNADMCRRAMLCFRSPREDMIFPDNTGGWEMSASHRWSVIVAGLLLISCGTREKRGELPAAAIETRAPEPDDRPVIIALGDSLTAGLGVDPAANYPAQLQERLASRGYRHRVVNAGVSGDTSAQGLNRVSALLELKPVIVIVALGANDGLRGIPPAETRRNLYEIIRLVRESGAQTVLAGMEMPPNYGPEYTAQFRAIFADLARKHGIPRIPFLLDGVAGVQELNQSDGIHPTAQGYSRVLENVWPALEPLLQR